MFSKNVFKNNLKKKELKGSKTFLVVSTSAQAIANMARKLSFKERKEGTSQSFKDIRISNV